MNEEDLEQKTEVEQDPIHKNFLVRVVVVFVLLVGLYYIISPYQNCMREFDNSRRCFSTTNF